MSTSTGGPVVGDDIDSFEGKWTNVDVNTRHIPQLQVTKTSPTAAALHVWGACTPTWCDWGTTTATWSGGGLSASYDPGFAVQTMRMTLSGGRLSVWTHTHYKDNSGRPDMDTRETMRKA